MVTLPLEMVTLVAVILLAVPPVIVTLLLDRLVIVLVVALAVVKTALPPLICTLDRVSAPLAMPLIATTTVEKLLSSCDNGIVDVALAKVLGITTGSVI